MHQQDIINKIESAIDLIRDAAYYKLDGREPATNTWRYNRMPETNDIKDALETLSEAAQTVAEIEDMLSELVDELTSEDDE